MITSNDRLPSKHFDTSVLDLQIRKEAWREFVRGKVDISPLRPSSDVRFAWDAWALKDVLVYHYIDDDLIGRRTKKHAEATQGILSIRVYRTGGARGLLGNRFWQSGAGHVHFMDFSLERYFVGLSTEADGVYLPHAAVGYDPKRHPSDFSIPVSSAFGRVLGHSIQSLLNDMPRLHRRDADTVRARLIGLLRGYFSAHGRDEEARGALAAARRAAIKDYIDTRIAEPALGVSELCQVFHISRSTLFRLFADVGGVDAYVRDRRTDHAFRDLVYAPVRRGAVKRAADRWGFNSSSHFNRRFKDLYGVLPGEVVGWVDACEELKNSVQKSPPWYLSA